LHDFSTAAPRIRLNFSPGSPVAAANAEMMSV
jgi:hypothetical protein